MPCDCPSCRQDNILNGTLTTEECPHCSVVFTPTSTFQIMTDKSLVCDACVAKLFVKCDFCNKLHKANDLKKAMPNISPSPS